VIQSKDNAGLVIIVDGLEKMSLRTIGDKITTHDRLFINRSSQLASLSANIVFTVPISLYYSPQSAGPRAGLRRVQRSHANGENPRINESRNLSKLAGNAKPLGDATATVRGGGPNVGRGVSRPQRL
jgi:hypothetical protein